MCRGNRKRDVTTMVTYSNATTPPGQSERAYYLSYFINIYTYVLNSHRTKIMRACARNAQNAGFVSHIKRVENYPRFEKLAHVIMHGLTRLYALST